TTLQTPPGQIDGRDGDSHTRPRTKSPMSAEAYADLSDTLITNFMAQIGAFFDVDRTLVACNTGRLFLQDLRRRGEISFLRALRAMGWMLKYHLSLIDLEAVAGRLVAQMRGWSEKEFAERCRRWVEDDVLPRLLPSALRKIERHRDQGHLLAILSSSPSY